MAKCPICGGPMKASDEVCENCRALIGDAVETGSIDLSVEASNATVDSTEAESIPQDNSAGADELTLSSEDDEGTHEEGLEDINGSKDTEEPERPVSGMVSVLQKIKGHDDFFGTEPVELDPEDIERYHDVVDGLENYLAEKGELYPSVEAYLYCSNLARIMGDTDIANDMINKAIRIDPNSALAWALRGRIFDQMGRIEDAIRSYERAMKGGLDTEPKLLSIVGQLYIDLGREDEALNIYRKITELNPQDEDAWENLGNLLYSQGEFAEAKKAYDKANQIRIAKGVQELDTSVEEGGEEYRRAIRLLKDVTDYLIEARNIGAQVEEAEEKIDDIKSLIKKGDYPEAIIKIDEFRNDIKESYRSRVEEAIEKAEETMMEIREEIVTPLGEELLDRAKDAYDGEDYKKAINYAHLSIEEANKAYNTFKDAKKAIQNAWNKISDAKKAGSEVSVAEVLLEQARTALKKKDFTKAREYAVKAEDAATPEREKQAGKIMSALDELRKKIDLLERNDVDITSLKRIAEAVEGRLEKDDLEKAEEYLQNGMKAADQELKKLLVREAADAISRAEAKMKEAEETVSLKELLRSPREQLERAQNDFNNEDFEAAKAQAEAAYSEIVKVIEENVFFNYKKNLDEVMDDIKTMRDQYGFTDADELLEEGNRIGQLIRARDLTRLKAEFNDFMEKYSKEKKRVFLGSAPLIFSNMERAIESVSGLSDKARDYRKRLDDIKRIFDMGNIERAMQYSMTLIKEINDLKKNRIKTIVPDELVRVRNRISTVRERGGYVASAEEKLKEAVALFDQEKYEEVLDKLSEIKKELRTEEIGTLVEDFKTLIERLKGYDVDTTELETLASGAEEKFRKKDIDGAENNIRAGLKSIILSIMKDILRKTRKAGIETKEAEYIHLEAMKEIDKADIMSSTDRAYKILDRLDQEIKKKEMIDLLKETRERILSLKAKGIDISEYKRKFVKAKDYITSGLIEEGEPVVKALREDVDKKYAVVCEKEEKVKDILREVKDLAHRISDLGGGKMVKEFKPQFDRAKNYLKEKRYDKALEAAEKCRSRAVEIFKYRNLIETLKMARKEIDTAEAMGIDVRRAEDIFRKAKPALESKDYDTATEFVTLAIEEVNKAKKKRNVGELIRKAYLKITTLKEKGVDVSISEGFLAEARTALRIEDLEDAEEKATLAFETAGKIQNAYEKAGGMVTRVEKIVEECRESGCSTEELEGKLNQLKKAVLEDDMDTAVELTNEISMMAEKLKKSRSEVEEVFKMAKNRVEELKKHGIKTHELDRYIAEMERAAGAGEIDRAKDLAKLAYEEAEKTKHTYNEVVNLIQLAQEKIRDTKAKGRDTSRPEAMFNEALGHIENGEYEAARKKVKTVISELLSAQLLDVAGGRNGELICPKCGEKAAPGSEFCSKCGTKLR